MEVQPAQLYWHRSELAFHGARTQFQPKPTKAPAWAGWKVCACISCLPSINVLLLPFHQPLPAVVFSPWWFFPNPSLRGALKTDVNERTAIPWLGDPFWSGFTSTLCQSPMCPPTDHLIIQCFALLSANVFKYFLFLDFFQFLLGVCTLWGANMVALLCLARDSLSWLRPLNYT